MENILDLNYLFYNCINEYENLMNEFNIQTGESNPVFKIIEKSNNYNTVWQTRETKYLIKFDTINQDFFTANQSVKQFFQTCIKFLKTILNRTTK